MKFSFEGGQKEGSEKLSNTEIIYGDILERVKKISVVSEKENKDWPIEELQNRLEGIFKEVGEKALLENQGKIYTTLSGGLDSTLALAFLRKNFPNEKIITFTLGGDEKHPDIRFARLAAEKFAAENNQIIPTPNELNEALAEYKQIFPGRDLKEAVAAGNFDVYLLYKNIKRLNPKSIIVHDGIDELMGGYWDHRKESSVEERKKCFNEYWQKLIPEHLNPLIQTTQHFKIKLHFPYLEEKLIKFISEIPIEDRVVEGVGKKPLRDIAALMEVPKEIIDRPKRGQVGMTEIEDLRKRL